MNASLRSLSLGERPAPDGPAGAIGVECEYAIFEAGRQVDFRTLLEAVVGASSVRLQAEGTRHFRFADGHLLSCDGWYAELSTPPEPLAADAPLLTSAAVSHTRNWLLDSLARLGDATGRRFVVTGHSTHLNVSAPQQIDGPELARRFALTFGPFLLFLTSVPNTLGIMCRPRMGRLEIVTEFIDDPDRLRAALSVLVGGVSALVAEHEHSPVAMPPSLVDAAVVAAPIRSGWQLRPERMSPRLRAWRRRAPLRTRDGVVPFQDLLELQWVALEPQLSTLFSPNEVALVREYLEGSRAAGIELPANDAALSPAAGLAARSAGENMFRLALAPPRLAGWKLEPVFVDWNFVVYSARGPDGGAVLNLPRRYLLNLSSEAWLAVAASALDSVAAGAGGSGAPLVSAEQTTEPGVFPSMDLDALAGDLASQGSAKNKKKKKGNCHAGVRLERLGPYPDSLHVHLFRPFYRRRTLEEQEGADLLIYPTDRPDLGYRQSFLFSIPPELEVDPALTIRVYTSPDRTSYTDYTGAPVVSIAGGVASIDVTSPDTIYFIHIIHIHYRFLLDLPGHGVEVEVTILPTESDARACSHRWVNLLLYENDLGDSHAGGGMTAIPGTDLFTANVSNGNVQLEIPLFAWLGRGTSIACALHYNSFHAAQLQAAEHMGVVNGVSPDEVELEYARTGPGFGWQWSYGIHLIDYVLSEGGENVRKRLELVAPDGNHTQLEQSKDGRFRPIERGTLFAGEPVDGMSLEVVESPGQAGSVAGYEMTDLHANRWRFDGLGRVEEIASTQAVNSGGKLAPLTVSANSAAVLVTDSVGRTLTASIVQYRIVDIRDQDQRQWQLRPGAHPSWLGEIGWPLLAHHGREATTFTYDPIWYFMASLTNRREFQSTINHVLAGDAWGRVQRLARGDAAWAARYDPVIATEDSTATVTDARGTDHRFTWDRHSLAVLQQEAHRKAVNTDLGTLDDEWILVRETSYFSDPRLGQGKLPERNRDLCGFVRGTYYDPVADGRAALPTEVKIGRDVLSKFSYDATTHRVFEATDANGHTTRHEYDAFGNPTKVTLPLLDGQKKGSEAYEEWIYGADGTLQSHRDRGGRKNTFGYGGARDPFGVGLPTTETLGGATWQHAYRRNGLVEYTVEPLYGGRTDFFYDRLDRVETVLLPEMPIVSGADEKTAAPAREGWTMTYDENGNLAYKDVPLNGAERRTFDRHDRPLTYTTSDGVISYDKYDGMGGLLVWRDRRQLRWEVRRDYLGRPLEIIHPTNGGVTQAELFQHSDDGLGDAVEYVTGTRSAPGQLGYPRRRSTSSFNAYGEPLEEKRWTDIDGTKTSTEARLTYARDEFGHLDSVTFAFHDIDRYVENYGRDTWYRINSVTVEQAETTYELGLLDEIRAVTTPKFRAKKSGRDDRATWRFDYDDQLRSISVTDPYGTVVRKVDYTAPTTTTPGKVEIFAIPLDLPTAKPLEHRSAAPILALVQSTTYNARGLAITEQTLDLPGAELFYDLRGGVVLEKRGATRTSFELDGQGRRTKSSIKSRARTITTEQRFDAGGNLSFLSGEHFDAEYEYDGADRMIVETRILKDKSRIKHQDITYDVFGRPVKKTVDEIVVISVKYDDAGASLTYDVVEAGNPMGQVGVSYHWNGAVASYSRRHAQGGEISFGTSGPDRYGRLRRTWFKSSGGGDSLIEGAVEVDQYPAGTRRSLTVTAGSASTLRTLVTRYDYHDDWQLSRVVSAHRGNYEFRYQTNGCLSSWKTRQGHEFVAVPDAYGGLASLETRRAGSTAQFVSSVTELYPPGHPDQGNQHTGSFEFFHLAGDLAPDPQAGSTKYATAITYDGRGLAANVGKTRTGTGVPISYSSMSTFKPDATQNTTSEAHSFPDGLHNLKRFEFERTYVKNGRVDIVRTSCPSPDPLIESQFNAVQETERDGFGRPRRITTRSIISPDVFAWFTDPRQWNHVLTTFDRDELGRVTGYGSSSSRSDFGDPQGINLKAQDSHTRVRIYRGPFGDEIGRRSDVWIGPTDKHYPTSGRPDHRLFIYDGDHVVAEITRYDEIVRYYEYGPGSQMRLSVMHWREVEGVDREVVDEYLYGTGLTSAALVGRASNSRSAPRTVARFAVLDMPIPGDNRVERLKPDQDEDAHLLSPGSPLYVGGVRLPRGGLPPQASGVCAIGSGIGDVRDTRLGALVPHRALLEDTYELDASLVDPKELPGPPPADNSLFAKIYRGVDWALSMLPYVNIWWRLEKSKMLVKQGEYEQAAEAVKYATVDFVLGMFAVNAELLEAEPLIVAYMEDVVTGAMTWYGRIQSLVELPDTLARVAGFDPETGADVGWDERIYSAVDLRHTMTSLRDGAKDLRKIPAVFNGDGCFGGSTMVFTDEGPRAIADLWPGERVIARAEDGALHTRRIEDIQVHFKPTLVIDADQQLTVSASQPMLVDGSRFVLATDLRAGDRLLDDDGISHRINRIQPGGIERVYGLTVAVDSTYLVGPAHLVAHNKPSLASGLEEGKRRAAQRSNSRIHTYSTRTSFISDGRPLAGSALQERHALAWTAHEFEVHNWVLVRPAKYLGNQGIDMIFKGCGPNAGRWLIVEVKHGSLGSLSTYPEGRQGSRSWAINRLQRAIDQGRLHGTGHLRYSQLLHEIESNSGSVQIVGALFGGGNAAKQRFVRFDPTVYVKDAPRLRLGVHFTDVTPGTL